ncbi:unnamed protein product [Paramecium sonneborni]|uniref:Uncharacterized protein n=1 Tax=Paramecium sonneborni TaxID=65129 RepID=A0A8S1Q9W4_9CILI|nr:unnamed protein product [Paramecium sonneborni]
MSENDSNSVLEVSAPIKGRLKRPTSSDEEIEEQKKDIFSVDQPDSIEISDQSDIQQIEKQKKQKKLNQNPQKPRKPRQKKKNENAANQNEENQEIQKKEKQQKQSKPKKKGVETNEKTLENLLNKKFIQAEEEDEPPRREMEIEYENNRNDRDTFGIDNKPNKRKAQNAKNINQLIKNRHKFFTEFEDTPLEFQNEHQNYQEIDDDDQFELKFEKQQIEESAIKQKAKRDMLNKVQQYKQNVLVFGDQQKSQRSLFSSNMLPSQDLELNANSQPKFPSLMKTTSFIQDEQIQKQEGESKNILLRKTYSMGLKKGLSQEDIEDPELQLFIPKINGAKDKIFENTLFLNKIKQKGFDRVVQTSTSLNNSNKAYSRSEFQQLLQQKQVEHKANKINLSLNELMNRFQSTTFEQIEQQRQKNQIADDGGQDGDDSSPDEDFIPKQGELNQESEDIDDGSSESNDNNKFIDNKVKVSKLTEKEIEEQEKNEIEKDKDFAVIIEEKSDIMSQIDDEEKKQLQQIKTGLQKDSDSDQNEDDEDDQNKEYDDEEEKKKEDHKIYDNNEQKKLAKIISSDDDDDDDQQVQEINEEDLNMFRRLKKVSTMFKERKKKEKELEEKKKQRLERQKEREKMRKFIESNLVEDQAEQGSDNESHDDVVKEIKDDDDDEEENDVIEKELLEMIDDKIEDLDEENEIRAFHIFMDRVHAQEKEDIKKILKGEFKRRNGKISNIDLINMEQTEEEKQARLMHKFEESEEENYDSDFENYLKMSKDQKKEFLKEKRLQKILQAQKEMNQQTKKNRLQEQQFFQPDLLKIVEQAKKKQQDALQKKFNQKPPTFGQTILYQKNINENSNAQNSNSISQLPPHKKDNKQQSNKTSLAINRLFSANLNAKGQTLQKSPNKAVLLGKKK